MKLKFSGQIFKEIFKWNFMKIRPVGAELFHADGETSSCFSQSGNAPKKTAVIVLTILGSRYIKFSPPGFVHPRLNVLCISAFRISCPR
jgi:hypothetical protein